MTKTALKFAAITSIALLASAGTAMAGGDKNCDEKKKAAMKTETAVLGASEKMTKVKKERKVMTLEDATKLCTEKGADDLQACIDYKTGVTKVYKKKTS